MRPKRGIKRREKEQRLMNKSTLVLCVGSFNFLIAFVVRGKRFNIPFFVE